MTTPRRRIVRPPAAPAPDRRDRDRQLQRLRSRLEKERAALTRWMPRLKRAFHTVERGLARIARIERQIARTED